MKIRILLSLAFMFCLNGCSSAELKPDDIQSVGGTNFAFYKIEDEYLERNEPNAWWKPGVLKHVVGAYHMQPEDFIRQTLSEMYQGGQRKIAIVLWHTNIGKDKAASGSKWTGPVPAGYEHIYGHTIDSAGGTLCAQHQKNLKAILELIQKAGFESVTIRFAAQGVNNPMEWNAWQETYYQENLSFILSTKRMADKTLSGRIPVYYDLGLELGGLEGFCTEYTTRLWQEYTRKFSSDDTIGFSFAVEPGRVRRMVATYKASGCYPVAYPLDVYYKSDQALAYVADEFCKAGLDNPPLIIQETFYNDAQTFRELEMAAKQYYLNILYIMQWQVERERMHWVDENGKASLRHFSISRPIEYDNYLKPLN